MENMCLPWGLPPPAYGFGLQQSRSRYSSTLEIRETCPASTQQDLLPRRQRSPSLPPISHYNAEQDQQEIKDTVKLVPKLNQGVKYRYEDGEGETSGYASDTVPQPSPEFWQNKQIGHSKVEQLESPYCRIQPSLPEWHHSSRKLDEEKQKRWKREGVSEEQRPRWGDRGVATGRLWEPQDPNARLPQVSTKGTPSWIERSLNMIDNGDSQILIIDQNSNHSSGGDGTDYREGSEMPDKNTYLLGQNVPIEPNIRAEREYKRLKALELQAAIMQQLEDRERQKREEKERRIREEREEEERFRKQQELEQQRLEEERRVADEKQRREQKRAEALRLALEKAEHQAKLDKENKKNRRLRDCFDSMSINSEDIRVDKPSERSPKKEKNQHASNSESKLIQNIYIEQAFNSARKSQDQSTKTGYQLPTETNIIVSNPQSARFSHQCDSVSSETRFRDNRSEASKQSSDSASAIINNSQPISMLPDASLSLIQIPLTQDLFTPVNFAHTGSVQMALLMPQNMNSVYPCIHQPISMQSYFTPDSSHKNNNMTFHTDSDEGSGRGSKVLTPSKYRNPNCKDVSTQTDVEPVPKTSEDKKKHKEENNFEENVEHNTSEEKLNSLDIKKTKKQPIDEKANKDLESRPKWGVNKPPTQYKKQSEKDIFYTQKRRLRQRKRAQEKLYTSHSSDDNRSPSPVKNTSDKNRVSLSDYHWRKKGVKPEKNPYASNVMVETTQILPLECDQSGAVHIGNGVNYESQKTTFTEKKQSASKRGMTLSQKFMNDKYGNPKLWQESQSLDLKGRLDNDKMRYPKKEQSNYYEDSNQPLILDQLRSLRNSLKKQQQIWGKYENRRSPSPKNEVDMELE